MHRVEHISGIYTISNILNNKIYVGCSVDIHRRFQEHKKRVEYKNHSNSHLLRAIEKDGIENFLFEVLEECGKDYLFSQEHYWTILLNTSDPNFGYNITPTNPYNTAGCSEETRKKRSISLKGIPRTPEWRRNLGNSNRGRKASPEAIRNQSLSHLGKKQGKEQIEKKRVKTRARYYRLFDAFTLDGEYINTFSHHIDAVNYFGFTENAKNNISANLKGEYKQTHGYIFKYKEAS